jgi:hypothetical protein
MRFHCPAVFAASHNSKCIFGLRLGLLGFYRGGALIATEYFTGECAERDGRERRWNADDNLAANHKLKDATVLQGDI